MKTDKFTLFVYCNFLVLQPYNRMHSKHKQKNCKHSKRKFYGLRFHRMYRHTKSKNYLRRRLSNLSMRSHVYWDTLYKNGRPDFENQTNYGEIFLFVKHDCAWFL